MFDEENEKKLNQKILMSAFLLEIFFWLANKGALHILLRQTHRPLRKSPRPRSNVYNARLTFDKDESTEPVYSICRAILRHRRWLPTTAYVFTFCTNIARFLRSGTSEVSGVEHFCHTAVRAKPCGGYAEIIGNCTVSVQLPYSLR